jgi:hypothetical protein
MGARTATGSRSGIVRSIEPSLGERELRLVVQLRRDDPLDDIDEAAGWRRRSDRRHEEREPRLRLPQVLLMWRGSA